jgi:type IV pilus assembly protein PilY1
MSKDGWYTTLPTNGERSLSRPTILGGIIFFTTFTPQSGDICTSAGEGQLYALFFKTGSAYRDSALGTATSGGSINVLRSTDLGVGLASQVSLQIGSQGSGAAGTTAPTPGCVNRVTLYAPMGAGNVNTMCVKVSNPWSRMLAWRDL